MRGSPGATAYYQQLRQPPSWLLLMPSRPRCAMSAGRTTGSGCQRGSTTPGFISPSDRASWTIEVSRPAADRSVSSCPGGALRLWCRLPSPRRCSSSCPGGPSTPSGPVWSGERRREAAPRSRQDPESRPEVCGVDAGDAGTEGSGRLRAMDGRVDLGRLTGSDLLVGCWFGWALHVLTPNLCPIGTEGHGDVSVLGP